MSKEIEREIRDIIEPEFDAAQGTPHYNWSKEGRNERELYIGGVTEDIASYIREKLRKLGKEIENIHMEKTSRHIANGLDPFTGSDIRSAVERMCEEVKDTDE